MAPLPLISGSVNVLNRRRDRDRRTNMAPYEGIERRRGQRRLRAGDGPPHRRDDEFATPWQLPG